MSMLNLTPESTQAIEELQDNTEYIDLLSSVEEFLHEIYASEDEEMASEFMLKIKNLRVVRHLLEKVYVKE